MRDDTSLIGHRFGRLRVLESAPRQSPSHKSWRCLCDCGSETTARQDHLKTGRTRSCGCLHNQLSRERLTRDDIGYSGAHERIRRMLGNAKLQTCVDCGRPAREWSYNGLDPAECLRSRNGSPRSFSLDPVYYEPRCASCHRKFDYRGR